MALTISRRTASTRQLNSEDSLTSSIKVALCDILAERRSRYYILMINGLENIRISIALSNVKSSWFILDILPRISRRPGHYECLPADSHVKEKFRKVSGSATFLTES